MQTRPLHYRKTGRASAPPPALPAPPPTAALTIDALRRAVSGWLLDGEIRDLSPKTLYMRGFVTEKLLWHLERENAKLCSVTELRRFLVYLQRGHDDDGGRWNAYETNRGAVTRKLRPKSTATYYAYLRAFFNWVVAEHMVDESPMGLLSPPIARSDQIQPFTPAQLQALLAAAEGSFRPDRNTAIVLFLLDTGVRAAELCALTIGDLDTVSRKCTVIGKGNKTRSVSYGKRTAKALWRYLRGRTTQPDEALFGAERGPDIGEPLTTNGLTQMIGKLGEAAKITTARCSPHTLRHTFAVSFLRNGGNVFTLQQILGHTSMSMTQRYVAYAQADVEKQHRMYSPADRL